MEEWIEEFLYRGRPPSGPDSEKPVDFQVTIGRQAPSVLDPDGPPERRFIGPLTPTQAAEAGWPLEKIVKGLNKSALASLDEARAIASEREAQIIALQKQVDKLGQHQRPSEGDRKALIKAALAR